MLLKYELQDIANGRMGGWAATKQSLQASRANAHACRFPLSLPPARSTWKPVRTLPIST